MSVGQPITTASTALIPTSENMIEYEGSFPIFDSARIKTYPLGERASKVQKSDLITPERAMALDRGDSEAIDRLGAAVAGARAKGKPVILFTGAHLIKNGFAPLILDLLDRRALTLVGMNAAGMIHDFELALMGRTSENVPDALPKGEFGFARETNELINAALADGDRKRLGAGEAVGRLIEGEAMPEATRFAHREISLLAGGVRMGVPVTMHASIGCDIIDQTDYWNPGAKGACSGRDFLIFCAEVEKMSEGGVFLNVGSAVSGPEVFLKAVSMCANVGHPPEGLTTASFDIRPANIDAVDDEREPGYYFRDVKSVVSRIPEAFGGDGSYIQGDHLETLPALYRSIVRNLSGSM